MFVGFEQITAPIEQKMCHRQKFVRELVLYSPNIMREKMKISGLAKQIYISLQAFIWSYGLTVRQVLSSSYFKHNLVFHYFPATKFSNLWIFFLKNLMVL